MPPFLVQLSFLGVEWSSLLCVQQGGPRPNSFSESFAVEKSLLTIERQLPCYHEVMSFLPASLFSCGSPMACSYTLFTSCPGLSLSLSP